MGHLVTGLISRPAVLEGFSRKHLLHGPIALRGGGLAILPLREIDLKPCQPSPSDDKARVLQYLSKPLLDELGRASCEGPLIYFETEYFGGVGGQGAAVFQDGQLIFGPQWAEIGPINHALKLLGTRIEPPAQDEFETVSLHLHRDSEGWLRVDERDVEFRPYVASDFEAVADLWARVNRELAPAGMEALFEQYIATTIDSELSRLTEIFSPERRNAFRVVELADGSRRIVATFAIECHSSDTTELRRMYIDAAWRGRGLAQRMLRAAEAMARAFGFSRMIVSTADVQRAALRFYTKSGFRRVRSEIAENMTVKQAGGGLLRHYFEKTL
jgi:GNAT superfamily N-acetyltransferase